MLTYQTSRRKIGHDQYAAVCRPIGHPTWDRVPGEVTKSGNWYIARIGNDRTQYALLRNAIGHLIEAHFHRRTKALPVFGYCVTVQGRRAADTYGITGPCTMRVAARTKAAAEIIARERFAVAGFTIVREPAYVTRSR